MVDNAGFDIKGSTVPSGKFQMPEVNNIVTVRYEYGLLTKDRGGLLYLGKKKKSLVSLKTKKAYYETGIGSLLLLYDLLAKWRK